VHPRERDWVVVGTSRGGIHSFDLREPHDRPALSFSRAFAQVHDLLFLPSSAEDADGELSGDVRLVSSADVTRRDASNQTLLVWDFRSATLLFDRLDADMHAFQCLRRHPTRAQFVAQSAADCAALFSSAAPYKRVRRKRPATTNSGKFASFSGAHQVAGYAIQCSFSADGSLFATGDASGRLVLYSDASGRVAQSVRLSDERTPVMCAEFSPRLLAAGIALAAGVYDGSIHVMSAQQVE
jgi:WD40 repeat protein